MYMINRAVAVIKPKQPFVDWINSHPDSAGFTTSLEEARQDCTAYLLPDYDEDSEAKSFIKDLSADIFEIELDSWYHDETTWPRKRDFQIFQKWFDVEIHSMVIDPYENEIVKEDY